MFEVSELSFVRSLGGREPEQFESRAEFLYTTNKRHPKICLIDIDGIHHAVAEGSHHGFSVHTRMNPSEFITAYGLWLAEEVLVEKQFVCLTNTNRFV